MFKKPLARKPYSAHPDDSHLEVVLHENFKGEYCTHILNNQTGGFVHGHYFGKESGWLAHALKDFNARGVVTKLNEVDGRVFDVQNLLAVIQQLTSALETAVDISLAGKVAAPQQLGKYAALGHQTLRENGIEG